MKLNEYNEKRDFNKTKEPKGKINKSKEKKLCYVVQYHEARAKHYDFRLEWKGVLVSFAVPKGLSTSPNDKRLAVKVEDHPYDYKDFEGVIPKGNYGAGTVEIFDKGYYTPLEDMDKGLKKGHLKVLLEGEKYKGIWSIVKIDEKNWLIINQESSGNKIQLKKDNKLPFKTCTTQLATLSNNVPTGKKWLFEIKYDGYRIVSFMENGKSKLFSRNQNDYSKKFNSIKKSLDEMCKKTSAVLDGEVVVFDENGKSDFGLLQENIKKEKDNFKYVVFDILALNNEDLRNKPLIKRKEILENFLADSPKNIIVSNFVFGKGKECFNLAKKLNLEGIVAKKVNSLYEGKRNEDWIKVKCYKRQEFVIGGYTTSDKNQVLSSLLLGYYKANKLIYIGKVGTGFSDHVKIELVKKFETLKSKKSYFDESLNEKNVTYLKPDLVAEIQFAEITKDKLLRQPSFIGLREDKKAKDVHLESEYE